MEHVLALDGEKFDHSTDLGTGKPQPDMIGFREQDFVKLYAWLDRTFPGQYLHEWKPFEHPQLGQVEVGGLDTKACIQNPPPSLLGRECERNTEFSLSLAGALPVVNVVQASAIPLVEAHTEMASRAILLRVDVQNTGFLPTNGSAIAVTIGAVRPEAVSRLKLSPGLKLIKGVLSDKQRAIEAIRLSVFCLCREIVGDNSSPSWSGQCFQRRKPCC